MNKYNSAGDLLDSYDLTDSANPETSFLNDVVLDIKGGYAYITDSGIPINGSLFSPSPGIIVINLNNRKISRPLDGDISVQVDPGVWVTLNGIKVAPKDPMETGADGIGLSCDKKTLYYTPLTSRTLYAINTEYLQDNSKDIASHVVKLGFKESASDGIMCSQNGRIYLTAIERDAVLMQSDIAPNTDNFQHNGLMTLMNDSARMQ